MPIDLAIITERLENYGGSEIYILECMRRWQRELDIVLYTTRVSEALLREYGIDEDRVTVKMLEQPGSRDSRFGLLEDLVIAPRIWERQIGRHDLYFQYLFPAQMVRKSPSIWFAAEPLRMLYDLRHLECASRSMTTYHVYPRMEYDTASVADLNVMLPIIEELDQSSQIETLVTNSRAMEGYLEGIYGRKADLVAYPGISLPADPCGPADNKTALFVGRFWRHKRIDLVIEALSLLPEGNLILVGEGAEQQRLEDLTRSLGLEGRVRFAGNVDNTELDRLFRSVTCGVYTPYREPFGIMPLEAAAYALPVVVSPDGGYTEALDASCAHVVSPEPERIAEALALLFSDHEAATKMGAAGRKTVEAFTWDQTAEKLLRLFEQKATVRGGESDPREFRPLLGAHYYPWYGAGDETRHWNENADYGTVEDLPIGGVYSSDDETVVDRHLELAEEAGLDYLVINLQVSGAGLDPHELRAVDLMFERAAEVAPDLSLCFMVSCDQADSATLESALAELEALYIGRPNYLRMGCKPVLWFFITEAFIGHFFYRLGQITESTRNYHRIAASGFGFTKSLPGQFGEFFDGWSLYSPLQVSTPAQWEERWSAGYRDLIEAKARDRYPVGGRELLKVYAICPGFDDTGLSLSLRSGSEHRRVPRDGGDTYARMQQSCLDQDDRPDLVVVTSFNEFHENTHIEPTEKTGRRYIEATQRFSEALRSGGGRDPRRADAPDEAVAVTG